MKTYRLPKNYDKTSVTKIEVVVANGYIEQRVYMRADLLAPGRKYTVAERVKLITGKSVPGMRELGKAKAAAFGVPYEEKGL